MMMLLHIVIYAAVVAAVAYTVKLASDWAMK